MIEKTRKSLGVSQAQLGRACGISRQMISDLEMGCYLAAPQLASRLRTELQSPGLSDQSHILPYREIQQLARLRPFELPPVNQEPWQRMHRFRSELVARIGLPSELAQWIENHLSCDSGGEGIGILSTAAAGARPSWASPTQCGYRHHCVLDLLGSPLGERLLPCLFWEHPEFKCVFWPQAFLLNAHGGYRPDGLLLVRNPLGRFWRALEQEGPLHESEPQRKWDIEREGRMGLGCIRIPMSEVLALRMPEILVREFAQLGAPGSPLLSAVPPVVSPRDYVSSGSRLRFHRR